MTTLAELSILLTSKDQASPEFDKVSKNAQGMGSKVGTAAKAVAAAGLVAGAGLAAMAVKAVNAASDMAEAQNKVNVVFGESAAAINDFAKDAAKNLGLSRSEALSATGTFGNLFVAMKIGQPQAADMSKGILTLASDLSSFNNIPVTDVLEKLRAGLVGETEPLRALGVNLTAASVKTKALEMGFKPLNGELDAAAKAQAAYALILEQTGTAQGDFKNTSTGMANSLRIIQKSFADITAEIGGALLPIIAPLISRFAQALPLAFDRTKKAIDGLKNLGAAFKYLKGQQLTEDDLKQLFTLPLPIRNALTPIRELMRVVTDLGEQFIALGRYVRIFLTDGDSLNDWLTHMSPAFQVLALVATQVITDFKLLGSAIKIVWEVIQPVASVVLGLAGNLLSLAFGVRETTTGLSAMATPLQLVSAGITAMIAAIVLAKTAAFAGEILGLAGNIVAFPFNRLADMTREVQGFVRATAELVSKTVDVTARVITRGAELAGEVLQTVVQNVKRTGDKLIENFDSKTQQITQNVTVDKPPEDLLKQTGLDMARSIAQGLAAGLALHFAPALLAGGALVGGAALAFLGTPLGIGLAIAAAAAFAIAFPEQFGTYVVGPIVSAFQALQALPALSLALPINLGPFLQAADDIKTVLQIIRGSWTILEGFSEDVGKEFAKLGPVIAENMAEVGSNLSTFVEDFRINFPENIRTGIETAQGFFEGFPLNIAPFLAAAAVAIAVFIDDRIKAFKQMVEDLKKEIGKIDLVGWIKPGFDALIAWFRSWRDRFMEGFRHWRDLIAQVVEDIKRLLASVGVPIRAAPSAPNPPGPGEDSFAHGGIVPGPLGAPRRILAHGGEAVIPAGAGGASPTINIYVAGSVTTDQDLLEMVRRGLIAAESRNVTAY